MNRDRKRSKRNYLMRVQSGLCHWCHRQMVKPINLGPHEKNLPDNLATFDHLDEKFTTRRGQTPGRRIVLACRSCNHRRGSLEYGRLSVEEQRQRSGRFPLPIEIDK